MIDIDSLRQIELGVSLELYSGANVAFGVPISKPIRVSTFSPTEWELFTEEWLSVKGYSRVARMAGAGDMGLDVICFVSDSGFDGPWDNYQCKHYSHALQPAEIWKEISKLIYYTYLGEFTVPRKYYFVAPHDMGTTVQHLLGDAKTLAAEARAKWVERIAPAKLVPLEGELLKWFESFDFSIFSSTSVVEMIREHANTAFHAVRFGGGLPARPATTTPPEKPTSVESRYVQQLLVAYSEHLKTSLREIEDLNNGEYDTLRKDLLRQRVRFYSAESLRNFARDTVPVGTFERLQDEVYSGVVEVCDSDFIGGLERMRGVIGHAALLSIGANPLASVVEIQDRQGICHQLANDDRLVWVRDNVGN